MIKWMILFLDILAYVLRSVICLFLICRSLKLEKPCLRAGVLCVVGTIVVVICTGLMNITPFYQGILMAFVIAFCTGQSQKEKLRMCLCISIFYEIAVSFWEFLLSAGLGVAWGSGVFLDKTAVSGQAGGWLLNLFLAVLALFVFKHPDLTYKEVFRLVSSVVMAGFIAVITLNSQTVLDIQEDTMFMWMILSVILMMAVLVLNISRQYEAEKELARLKSEQAELLERDYTTLNQAYSVNAKLFHDFHNHIGVLRQFLKNEKYQEAAAYLDELQEPLREMTDTVWTGDETIDYLINSKMAAAADRQISLQAEVEFPRHTNIRSADLSAILGNLLDNALEAAEKVNPPEQRTISLTIRRIHQMLVIKVENHFAETIRAEHGQLKTTKTQKGLHGWGLKSAQAAAAKYDGTVSTDYEDGLFRAVATLSYHGVTKE